LRSVVWRELPYSARRSLVGVLRTLDNFEDFVLRVWRSFRYSPEWIFVAIVGGVGIVLTILLFFLLARELMRGPRVELVRPIIDPLVPVAQATGALDSKLCLLEIPGPRVSYPAEFDFSRVQLAHEGQPPTRRPPRRRSPVVEEYPDPANELADVDVEVSFWHQPLDTSRPAATIQVLKAASEFERPPAPFDVPAWGDDPWSRARRMREVATAEPQPYPGDTGVTLTVAQEPAWDDFSAYPSRADIGMQVELHAPLTANAREAERSRLVIKNTGPDTIRRIEVQEPVRPLEVVTDAEPPATLTDGTLYRELLRLGRGREKSLELQWTPDGTGDRQHEARVLAEAFVAASVDVIREPARIAQDPEAPIDPAFEFDPEPTPAPEPMPEPAPEPAVDPLPVIEAPRERPAYRPPSRRPKLPVTTEPEVVPTPEPVEFGAPPATADQPLDPEFAPEPAPIVEVVPAPAERIVAPPPAPLPAPSPTLACRVTGDSEVTLHDVSAWEIEVSNTGSAPLSDVRIWADLPDGVIHQHGRKLELRVGALAVGATHKATLRVIGGAVGVVTAKIQAVARETASQSTPAVLAITEPVQTSARAILPAKCDCRCAPQVTQADF
jgi:hypothetical protein